MTILTETWYVKHYFLCLRGMEYERTYKYTDRIKDKSDYVSDDVYDKKIFLEIVAVYLKSPFYKIFMEMNHLGNVKLAIENYRWKQMYPLTHVNRVK